MALLARHPQRLVQGVGRLGDVVGIHDQRVGRELVRGPGLPGQDQGQAVPGQDRAFLGHQVHPVADGVDQQDIGDCVGGQRACVVVADVEHERLPGRGAELVADLLAHPQDAAGVLAVLGDAAARRVGQRDVRDPVAPFGAGAQQLPVGLQAADDVLRQLHPVDPHDRLPPAQLVAQRRSPGNHIVAGGPPAQLVAVDAEGVHAQDGVAPLVPDDVAADVRVQDLGAAVRERGCPSGAEESGAVRAQDPGEDVTGDRAGQHPEVLRRRPRRVTEEADPQVGAAQTKQARGQRQVVVLHEDHGSLRGVLCDREGERPAVALVAVPLFSESGVEAGRHGGVEQHVGDEPEDAVGDRVIGAVEDAGIDGEHAHPASTHVVAGEVEPPVRGFARGAPVRLGHGAAHPQRPAALSTVGLLRGRLAGRPDERADQTAAAAPQHQLLVLR